ncbi:hypothetical protein GE21DRAFT_1073331 [Neurospora crassa]|nr:hypothetical protein GE21DRAFT_1073331 [Neurospora crassa]
MHKHKISFEGERKTITSIVCSVRQGPFAPLLPTSTCPLFSLDPLYFLDVEFHASSYQLTSTSIPISFIFTSQSPEPLSAPFFFHLFFFSPFFFWTPFHFHLHFHPASLPTHSNTSHISHTHPPYILLPISSENIPPFQEYFRTFRWSTRREQSLIPGSVFRAVHQNKQIPNGVELVSVTLVGFVPRVQVVGEEESFFSFLSWLPLPVGQP